MISNKSWRDACFSVATVWAEQHQPPGIFVSIFFQCGDVFLRRSHNSDWFSVEKG
jgi:hypothetical protein